MELGNLVNQGKGILGGIGGFDGIIDALTGGSGGQKPPIVVVNPYEEQMKNDKNTKNVIIIVAIFVALYLAKKARIF